MDKLSQEQLAQQLGSLSVMELIALTKKLEQDWGVKAAPSAPKVSVQEEKSGPEEVKTEFDVTLISFPADRKMNVIKAIREVMVLGLKESKDFAESVPKLMKEAVSKEEADTLVAKMMEAGAVVEVK